MGLVNEIKSGSSFVSRVSLCLRGGTTGAANEPVLTELCRKPMLDAPTDAGRDDDGVRDDGRMLCAEIMFSDSEKGII